MFSTVFNNRDFPRFSIRPFLKLSAADLFYAESGKPFPTYNKSAADRL